MTVDGSGNVTLRIYVDRSSVEVFAQNGLRTITDQVFPEQVPFQAEPNRVALFAEGGTARLKSLSVTPLSQSMFQAAQVPTKNRR